MVMEDEYLEINRHSWNNRTDVHIKSEFYDLDGFQNGKTSLKSIELDLLGNLEGKSILHLQCHFGQDTISLGRLGADVTGIDISDKAIEHAKRIAKDEDSKVNFICCNIYDLPNHLDKQFDIIFTSYGVIGWLPDLNKWANIISGYLKLDGKFIFVEFHPVVWMFNDSFDKIDYSYFNSGPILETEIGTYADKTADITQEYVMWNHSMSEVVNSLIKNGLKLEELIEYDYSPYDCFDKTKKIEADKFRIKHLDNKIPMVYSILAAK